MKNSSYHNQNLRLVVFSLNLVTELRVEMPKLRNLFLSLAHQPVVTLSPIALLVFEVDVKGDSDIGDCNCNSCAQVDFATLSEMRGVVGAVGPDTGGMGVRIRGGRYVATNEQQRTQRQVQCNPERG